MNLSRLGVWDLAQRRNPKNLLLCSAADPKLSRNIWVAQNSQKLQKNRRWGGPVSPAALGLR